MRCRVDMGKQDEIKIMPESTEQEIIQNLGFIVATAKESGPMCRDVGLSTEAIGGRDAASRALLTRDIFSAVQELEYRVTLRDVTFEDGSDGKYTAVMEVEINE